MLTPAVAQLVDHVLDRAEDGPQGDDDRLCILGPVGAHQPSRGAPEGGLEVLRDPGDRVERLHLLRVHQILDLGEGLRAHHRADRHGL